MKEELNQQENENRIIQECREMNQEQEVKEQAKKRLKKVLGG